MINKSVEWNRYGVKMVAMVTNQSMHPANCVLPSHQKCDYGGFRPNFNKNCLEVYFFFVSGKRIHVAGNVGSQRDW